MRFLIDAYNVIFSKPGLFKDDRDVLIDFLECCPQELFHVVFDAHFEESLWEKKQWRKGIKIIFTALGQTADDYILAFLNKHSAQEWTVVSNDQKIIQGSYRLGAKVLSSQAFIQWIKTHESLEAPETKPNFTSPLDFDRYLQQFSGEKKEKPPFTGFQDPELQRLWKIFCKELKKN